jgi:hypothetical protein
MVVQNLLEKEFLKYGLKVRIIYNKEKNFEVQGLKFKYEISLSRRKLICRNLLNDKLEILIFDYSNLTYKVLGDYFMLIHIPKFYFIESIEGIINLIKEIENHTNLKEYFKKKIHEVVK